MCYARSTILQGRAVAVVPHMIKGGFVFGALGGSPGDGKLTTMALFLSGARL
jgi:hypothetical protein